MQRFVPLLLLLVASAGSVSALDHAEHNATSVPDWLCEPADAAHTTLDVVTIGAWLVAGVAASRIPRGTALTIINAAVAAIALFAAVGSVTGLYEPGLLTSDAAAFPTAASITIIALLVLRFANGAGFVQRALDKSPTIAVIAAASLAYIVSIAAGSLEFIEEITIIFSVVGVVVHGASAYQASHKKTDLKHCSVPCPHGNHSVRSYVILACLCGVQLAMAAAAYNCKGAEAFEYGHAAVRSVAMSVGYVAEILIAVVLLAVLEASRTNRRLACTKYGVPTVERHCGTRHGQGARS